MKDRKDERDEMATSNDLGEVPISLPHSKSLSNNRSRSSQQGTRNELGNEMNRTNVNFPYQFIPIILNCCPNVVKGEQCNCGHNSYYPANDFYSNQMSKFLNN